MDSSISLLARLFVSLGLILGLKTAQGFISPCECSAQNANENGIVETIQKESGGLPAVTMRMVIEAPAAIVWSAIKRRRTSDLCHRQLLNYSGNVAVIKEIFRGMPVIGDTICTYEEQEVKPSKELEYKLLNSDHFKAFEGSWLLSDGPRADTTVVSLSSIIDPGIRCPLWRFIARGAIERNVKETLEQVSDIAAQVEKEQSHAIQK